MFSGGYEKSKELAKHYAALATFLKVEFFDAGQVISTDGVDGIHFSAETNVKLGHALAMKVASNFANETVQTAA